jgi:hypothetical protein
MSDSNEFTARLSQLFKKMTAEKQDISDKSARSERYNNNEPRLFDPKRRWVCQAGCNSNCRSAQDMDSVKENPPVPTKRF